MEKEKQGITVIRQRKRDPSNEFAKALNIICRKATGDFICPLQGDVQFVLKGGWLKETLEFYSDNLNRVGYIVLDAQRRIRNEMGEFSSPIGKGDFKFVLSYSKYPIGGGGDVIYSKRVIDMIYPWNENNLSHEGGHDSETAMLQKIQTLMMKDPGINYVCAQPIIPVSIAIQTDPRGTNARVRGNRRYGLYWPAKDKKEFRYYKMHNYDTIMKKYISCTSPMGIEDIVMTHKWPAPLDENGAWLKNPINPETATEKDYVEINK